MSRMSEQHDDLSTIHAILLGQRGRAERKVDSMLRTWGAPICEKSKVFSLFLGRIETIDDLLTEIEAAGVVWPDNVVELNTVPDPYRRSVCVCGGDIHPEHGPNC